MKKTLDRAESTALEHARSDKERLVAEAEAISGSTDGGTTAAAYRELMRQWKLAGRASRDAEE